MPPVFGQWARPVARFKSAVPNTSNVAPLALPVGRWLRYQQEWAQTCVRAACVKKIRGHGPDMPPVTPHRIAGVWEEALEAHARGMRERELLDDEAELLEMLELRQAEGEDARASSVL